MTEAKFKIGDRVYGKYRGTGVVIEPTKEDLAKAHFAGDICIRWQINGLTDWHGASVLEPLT